MRTRNILRNLSSLRLNSPQAHFTRFRAPFTSRLVMSRIISEIILATVEPGFKLDSPAFAKLRDVVVKGGVKEQYFGISTDEQDKLLWVIQWPVDVNPVEFKGTDPSEDFRVSLKALDVSSDPRSWYMPFESADLVRPALTAPICQLCTVHLDSASKRDILADSLHKACTDCYEAPGFTGGHWSTAVNDNRMNYYYLGWQTRELHDEYAKTDLFFVEMNKLAPHTDEGTTHYMKMTQQLN